MTSALSIVCTIIIMLMDTFAYYRLLSNKLVFRFSRRMLIPCYSICVALYFTSTNAHLWFPNIPLKLPLMLLEFFWFFIIYKGAAYKRLLWIFTSFFLFVACELITIPFFLIITHGSLADLLSNFVLQYTGQLFSRILIFIIIELLIRTKKKLFDGFVKDFFLIILVTVGYSLIIVSLFYYNHVHLTTETAITLSLFVMFLITFLALYLLRKITRKSEEIMTTNLRLQQIEMEHKQNRDMAIVVEDLRSLRHDMNNHMSVLQGLLTMEEYEDAKNYLSTITEELTVANSFVFIDNKVLSVLINNKISKARQLGITLETEFLTTATPFSDSDLCAVLGNILENAIEASSNHENSYIYFSMSKQDDRLLIQCDNTYTIPPVFEKGHLVTTKADKAYHGIGTKTICSVVEGYHGTTRFTVDELFHVSISVPLSNNTQKQ